MMVQTRKSSGPRRMLLRLFARDFSCCQAGDAATIISCPQVVCVVRAICLATAAHWLGDHAKRFCRGSVTSGDGEPVPVIKAVGKFGIHEFVHAFFVHALADIY